MTSAHILYIPIVFLLGFLSGTLLTRKPSPGVGNHYRRPVSRAVLAGSFVIFLVAFIGTHFFPIPRSSKAVSDALEAEIFDKKPSYSDVEVYERIASFPDAGRLLYQEFTYTIDVIFPLTLFTFLAILGRYTTSRVNHNRKGLRFGLVVLPIVWFASDLAENAVIFYLLSIFPTRSMMLAGLLGYLTSAKFTLLLLSIALPASVLVFSSFRKPMPNEEAGKLP